MPMAPAGRRLDQQTPPAPRTPIASKTHPNDRFGVSPLAAIDWRCNSPWAHPNLGHAQNVRRQALSSGVSDSSASILAMHASILARKRERERQTPRRVIQGNRLCQAPRAHLRRLRPRIAVRRKGRSAVRGLSAESARTLTTPSQQFLPSSRGATIDAAVFGFENMKSSCRTSAVAYLAFLQ
jgi:hypothetical protein